MFRSNLKRKYNITDDIIKREKEQVLKNILSDNSSEPKNLYELIKKKEQQNK